MDEVADEMQKAKPKLTPQEQIAFLKSKGVTFRRASEIDAMKYLSGESYLFAAYTYRTLFPKRIGGAHNGEYANLDFQDLVDLERLDRSSEQRFFPLHWMWSILRRRRCSTR